MTTSRHYRPRARRCEGWQQCNDCGEWKPANAYYFRPDPHVKKNGLHAQCRDCEARDARNRWRKKHWIFT